jgi:hypothetical protein
MEEVLRLYLCNYDWIRTNFSFAIKSRFQLNLGEVPPTNGLIIICEVNGFEPFVCTCTTLTRPLQELQLCYNLCIDLYAFPLAITDNGIEPLLFRTRVLQLPMRFTLSCLIAKVSKRIFD